MRELAATMPGGGIVNFNVGHSAAQDNCTMPVVADRKLGTHFLRLPAIYQDQANKRSAPTHANARSYPSQGATPIAQIQFIYGTGARACVFILFMSCVA